MLARLVPSTVRVIWCQSIDAAPDQYSVLISDIVLSDPGVISIIETTFSADIAHHMFSFV